MLAINGHAIRDVLDYRFYLAEPQLTLSLVRDGHPFEVSIVKPTYDDIGLGFATALMDSKQSCRNGCVFCFIDQLPHGMRQSLYFKDDDARLSFLHGNYITLTNLSRQDVDRIIAMRISPIRVSIHTTNPALRVRMMKNKCAGEALSYLTELSEAGIALHGQIVLCRGLNDGDELHRTLADLTRLTPALESVSVVPVGLTDHRQGLYPLEPFSAADAEAVIQTVDTHAAAHLARFGTRLFFCADEFYLKAGLPLPDEAYYEGYPQIENGVGMLRSLLEETTAAIAALPETGAQRAREVSVATGVAAYPYLLQISRTLMQKVRNLKINVYKMINRFFGENITVAGLLTGGDLRAQLAGKPLGQQLLLSANTLRAGEAVFLDDMRLEELAAALGVPVRAVSDDGGELINALLGMGEDTWENQSLPS